jgi:hypothetical protein
MSIRTLQELQEPDEVVLRFTPLGLSTGSRVLRSEGDAGRLDFV